MSYAQTKCKDDPPWCGDDVDVLDLGAAIAWVMLGAISAAHHGWTIFSANRASRGPLDGVREVNVGTVPV